MAVAMGVPTPGAPFTRSSIYDTNSFAEDSFCVHLHF